MKKRILSVLCLFLLAATCLSLAACGTPRSEPPIDFGKKYFLFSPASDNAKSSISHNIYLVFESDHTGYYDFYPKADNDAGSYRVDFEWREGNDNAVYLFATEIHYKDDSAMEGYAYMAIRQEEYIFFDEYLVSVRNATAASAKYVKEGSELEKTLDRAN